MISKLAGPDWNRAAQLYLAASALHRSLADYDSRYCQPAWQELFAAMRQQLEFPANQDSPGRPPRFEPILAEMRRLLQEAGEH